MDLSAAYASLIRTLLPRGVAWEAPAGGPLRKLLEGAAEEFRRAHERGLAQLEEADPRTANETLADWEEFLALPEAGTSLASTVAGRRQAITAKLIFAGGQSRQFFIDLAAELGYTITITEFRQFLVGFSSAGDALTNGDWVFAWRINAPLNTTSGFRAGRNAAGEPLSSWGNGPLEAAVNAAKPAHTILQFNYS